MVCLVEKKGTSPESMVVMSQLSSIDDWHKDNKKDTHGLDIVYRDCTLFSIRL